MKHFAIFLILISGFACKKSSDLTPINSATLIGKWEIRHISFDTNPELSFAPGNGHFLQFDGNNFKEFTIDTIYTSGTYSYLGKQSSRTSDCTWTNFPKTMDYLQWGSIQQSPLPNFFILDKDTLTFSAPCGKNSVTDMVIWERVK